MTLTDDSPATGRHIRSLWSLRSGGQGLREYMIYGSAVGAIYPKPYTTRNPSLRTIYFIEFESLIKSY